MANETYIWNKAKAKSNLSKHRISFKRATEVFEDALRYEFSDALHSDLEIRHRVIGALYGGRMVVVVFTLTSAGQIRLIAQELPRGSRSASI